MLKHLFYLLASFLLFPVFVHGDELISVSLGSQKMPMPAGRLDFGLLGGAAPASAVLTVTNLSTKTLVLDVFGFGNNVRAVWQTDTSSKPPSTRIELPSQQRASLKIQVTPGGPPGTYITDQTERGEARTWENDGRYPVVTISNGAAIATIQIAYIEVATLPYNEELSSDSLPSGLGEWWSPMYNLCLVATKPHFKLRPGSAHVDIISENPAHERGCGRWAACNIYKQDDSEVCVQIQVQGHHEPGGSKDGHNEVVMFHFTLRASYDFIPQPPPVLGEAFK